MRQNETPYFWHMCNLVEQELFNMSQELDHLDNRLYKTESKRVNNLYVAVVSDSDEYDKDNQPNTVYIIHTNDEPIFRFGHWLPSNKIIRLQRTLNIEVEGLQFIKRPEGTFCALSWGLDKSCP